MSTPPAKQDVKAQNRQAIKSVLEAADRDLDKQTIADQCSCSRSAVLRHLREMDDVVETRQIGNVPLYELADSQHDTDDLHVALDALERSQTRRAQFFLRRALGEPTDYEEMGGHIFRTYLKDEERGEVKECVASGCELMQGNDDWEDIKRIARDMDCPAPLEGIDARLPSDWGF
jgi:hypothetical protein